MPPFIAHLLSSSWFLLFARLVLTFVFWSVTVRPEPLVEVGL